MNLLLAIYYEHKQRTGHDVFTKNNQYLHCDVCLYIDAEKRKLDKAEKEYFEQAEAGVTQ